MPRKRSELEGFVLGLVWQLGASTPYEVRNHLKTSPSTQWSASAGAIYPLIQRLEGAGMLRARLRKSGRRAGHEYEITPKGLVALRAWIGPPLSPEAISVAHDPLRSRARFLAALSAEQQLAWIAAARTALDEVERKVRAWQAEHTPRVGAGATIATRSGELDVSSRREWLRTVEALAVRPG